MLRSKRLSSLLVIGVAATIWAPHAVAQALDSPPVGLPHWDATNQVLFFGGGVQGPFFVRGYVDAHRRGADINMFKDFPGLQQAIVDSVTAGPDNATLIAATLNFGGRDIRMSVLTYDSSAGLVKSWASAPQYAEAIAYSKDDDAIFVLGDRDVPNGSNVSDYPLVVEYSRDGRVLKGMVPVSTLKNSGNSFDQGGEIGQPALRITKDRIYLYAPRNREVVMCDRNGVVLAYRSISDIVEKISTEDGYHLNQIHQVDFSGDGNIVLELLLSNNKDYSLDVFQLNIKTGEAIPVHKAVNGGGLSFIGVKDGQYLYIGEGGNLYVQSDEAQEPEPLSAASEKRTRVH